MEKLFGRGRRYAWNASEILTPRNACKDGSKDGSTNNCVYSVAYALRNA